MRLSNNTIYRSVLNMLNLVTFCFIILVGVVDRNGDEWITVDCYIAFGAVTLLFLFDLVIFICIRGFKGVLNEKSYLIEVFL